MYWFKLESSCVRWDVLFMENRSAAALLIDIKMRYWRSECDVSFEELLTLYPDDQEAIEYLIQKRHINKTKSIRPKIKIPTLDFTFKQQKTKKFNTSEKTATRRANHSTETLHRQTDRIERIEKTDRQKGKNAGLKEDFLRGKNNEITTTETTEITYSQMWAYVEQTFYHSAHSKQGLGQSCSKCHKHYQKTDWKDKSGRPVKSWKGVLDFWLKNDGFEKAMSDTEMKSYLAAKNKEHVS